MKRSIRVLGLLLALCLLLSTAAFAAETKTQVVQELDVAITLPEDWEIYGKEDIGQFFDGNDVMAQVGAVFEEIGGVGDQFLSMTLDSFYLLAGKFPERAQEVDNLFFCEVIAVDQKALWDELTGGSMEYVPYDYSEMTDEELSGLAGIMNALYSQLPEAIAEADEGSDLHLEMSCAPYRNEQAAFLALSIKVETEELQFEAVYYITVRGDWQYEIAFASVGEPFTEARLETVQEIMDSVRFNQSTYSPSGFVDVKGHWAEENITKAAKLGLFTGSGDQKFNPNDGMTRAMLVQVLHRLAGEPEAESGQFTDVAENAWYAKAVAWAAENGIVEGDDGLFRPNDLVKRQELAAILYRYDASAAEDAENGEAAETAEGTLTGFADAAAVAQWAQAPVAWAVEQGLLNGSGGSLLPAKTATRAEVAAILVRYLEAA